MRDMVDEKLTTDQTNALAVMRSGKNVFLTGGAGVGKSYVIGQFCCEQALKGKKVLMTASTGIAAWIIGGSTVHRALKLWAISRGGDLDYMCENLNKADILIIDEISMISSGLFNLIFACIRNIKHSLQVIVVGDFFQLPPVNKRCEKYEYAFLSYGWQELGFIPCMLTKVVRQKDEEFIRHLERIRVGDRSGIPYFEKMSCKELNSEVPYICGTRSAVHQINSRCLNELPGKEQVFYAEYDDQPNESDFIGEIKLVLKPGMQLMCLINDRYGRFQNGSIGILREIGDDSLLVDIRGREPVEIGRHQFVGVEGKDSEKNGGIVTVSQFPVKASYAITVHKSQGQSFDSANIMMDRCWAPGQFYVALSRCKNIHHVYFQGGLNQEYVIVDTRVKQFYKSLGCKNVG